MNWGIWILMFLLVGSQFLGIVWSSSKSVITMIYGNDLDLPPAPIPGFNDEPYADRAIVCLSKDRTTFVPAQLTTVLHDSKLAPIVDSSGASIDGFRVVERTNPMELQPQAAEIYSYICDHVNSTYPAIHDSCQALGYNVTYDSLRIVLGVESTITQELPSALPILILPMWDNANYMVFVIPAKDGSACIFMLNGIYQSPTMTYGVLGATTKDVRFSQISQRLKKPGGAWRNGWYEALDGTRWYTNMISTSNSGPYGLVIRNFDTLTNTEIDCDVSKTLESCRNAIEIEQWGHQIIKTLEMVEADFFFATNGSRFGLFRYESRMISTVTNVYSLETFISNISAFILLLRWFVSLGAMFYSWYQNVHDWETTNIGALASLKTFNLLPIILLPRLKLIFTAFFTVGCFFEGQQSAFAEAWYIIYPGIVECLLYYYSVLNIIARISYRRMSDAWFGPTLVALCALHYFRKPLAEWSVLGLNDRIATLLLSDQIDALTITDFFTTNVAMRINGNAQPIFYIKIVLLLLNLIPLVLAENMTEKRGRQVNAFPPCEIEQILALRASNLGGLGQSPVYAKRNPRSINTPRSVVPSSPTVRELKASFRVVTLSSRLLSRQLNAAVVHPKREELGAHVLIGYEVNRLGYLVFGGSFLLSFDDWYILTSLAPLRVMEKLWNYRIIAFEIERDADGRAYRVLGRPQLCRLDDPRLRAIPFYDITVCAFQ